MDEPEAICEPGALQGLEPTRPRSIVERVVWSTVAQVVQPWMQEQQRKQDVDRAASQAVLFCKTRLVGRVGWGEQATLEHRVREQVNAAIAVLPETATFADMAAVASSTGQRVAQEVEEQQDQELRVAQEQREQKQRELQKLRDQRQREIEVDIHLGNFVLPSLIELKNEPEARIEFEAGEIFEFAPRIKTAIKPLLLQDSALNYSNARQRVRELVNDWIDANVRDEAE